MPQLLVSVRNPSEAVLAASCGAEIIDLKEPASGALGPVAPDVRDEIARRLGAPHRPAPAPLLSVALGELCDYQRHPARAAELSRLQAFRFAKVGLAGTRGGGDWQRQWRELVQLLPAGTIPVAAAYADAAPAEAPEPEEVLQLALELELPVFLLDTFHKTQGNLFDVLSPERLERLQQQAAGRVRFAFAGSLTLQCAPQLRRLQPDIVALRGAVCRAGRNSPLSAAKVRRWKSLVSRLADSSSLGSK